MNFNQFFVYFFESVSIFMSVFFFIQFFIIRRKEHLFYAIYLMALSVYYLLAVPDFFFGVAASDSETIRSFDLFKRPVQFLSSVFYTLFVMYYLGLASKSAYLYSVFRFLNILYLVCSITCLALNFFAIPYDQYYYLFSLILFPIQFYVVVALFKYRVPYGRYIIWGSIITLLGSALALIFTIYVNNHPGETFAQSLNVFLPVNISIAIDIFLFSIALQKKIADNEKSLISTAFLRQQAIMLERERIIADLHDDVGGGISSIRMMSDLMAQHAKPGEENPYGSFPGKISQTAREVAQRMHTIIWSLTEENDTLGNFIEYVRQYGISYFDNSGVAFSLIHSVELPSEIQLSGVQRKNLFLVMKEALHNILKHADARHAKIEIALHGKRLEMLIIDDGKGISTEPEGEGNGFGNGSKNMKKRMEEINGQLEYKTGDGTRIQLSVEL